MKELYCMEELYRANAKLIYHFLYRQCHDHALAEDLMQETFLQATRSIERYDGSCKMSVWLCQIAKHLLYQHYRKLGREIPAELLEETAPENSVSSPEQTVVSRLELIDVLKEMQSLPEQMREVIYLRVCADLSFREIGEILGKTENWARVNFYRGKELLLKKRKQDT